MIYFNTKLDSELDTIKQLLIDSGYPQDVYIENLNRLLSHGSLIDRHKVCEKCLKRFSSKEALESEIHKCNYKNN